MDGYVQWFSERSDSEMLSPSKTAEIMYEIGNLSPSKAENILQVVRNLNHG